MIEFVGNMSLRLGERIECYYNRKTNMISIRSIDIRNDNYMKIVAYADCIHLEDVSFLYQTSNQRKIFKGNYAGSLPIFPNREHMILNDGERFYTTSGMEVVGAKFAICYKDMLLAEKPKKKGAEWNDTIHEKWII